MRWKTSDARVARQHNLEREDRTSVRQNELKKTDWRRELIQSIASELEPQLIFSTMGRDVGFIGIEQICKATSASRQQFEEWCQQVQLLVDRVVTCAIELEAEDVPDETVSAERAKLKQELLQGIELPTPPDPIVDFKFADLMPEQASQSAIKILRNECVTFASSFVRLLLTLQDKLIVGSIEHTRTSCKAEFYRHQIVFEASGSQLRRYPSHASSDAGSSFRVDVYREQGFKVTTSTVSHVHHVHHPVRRHLGSEKHPIPCRFIPILDTIPNWIAPSLRILEGMQINEIQREERTSEHANLKRQYVSSVWQLEPAILIGNFVLAGWNEREIELEERRRGRSVSANRFQQSKTTSTAWLAVAGLLGAASIACMALSARSQSLPLLSLLLGTGAVYAGSHASALSRKDGQGKSLATLIVLAETTFALLAFVYGFASGSVAAMVCGIVAIAAAAVMLWGRKAVDAVREEFGE